MSDVKFITRTPDGREQLNGSFLGMYFLRKTRIPVVPYFTVYRVSADAKCVAFKAVNKAHWLACSPGRTDNKLDYTVRLSTGTSYTSGEVDVYEFAEYSSIPSAGHKGDVRFNLYTATGELSFAGTSSPLKVPYVLTGSVVIQNDRHINGGYDKTLPVNPQREYAIIFSPFQPHFQSIKSGGNIGVFEIVARFSDDNTKFMTKQYRHYLGQSSSGFGFTADLYGSSQSTHLIADVTNL